MTVRVYLSTDADAPVLNGTTAGAIITLLDACLVNGYGNKPPAGWSKPFSGTNLAAYRQGAGSNGMYLRINDTMTGSNRAARVVAFETMSDINTGTGQFPTNVQLAGGFWWPSVNATVVGNRVWMVVATEKMMYLYLEGSAPGTDSNMYRGLYEFGDLVAYKPGGDPFLTILSGQTVQALPSSQPYQWDVQQFLYQDSMYRYVARSHTGIGSSAKIGRHSDTAKTQNATTMGASGMQFPNPIDGGLYLSPLWVNGDIAPPYSLRGEYAGLWNPCHSVGTFVSGDTWEGTGPLAGKTFMAIRQGTHWCALEISDTW